MIQTTGWALLLAAALALGSAPGAATQAAVTAPPVERWRVDIDPGRPADGPIGVAIERNRVVIAGSGGGDAVTSVLNRANGRESWMDRYDTGATEVVVGLATDRRTFYVVGNISAAAGCPSSSSFARAVPIRSGAPRWLAETCTGPDAPREWLRAAALADKRLVVVGRIENSILVRAHRASTGKILWEDAGPGPAVSETATRVMVADGRVYVIGDRDTVLGRAAVYVARAYDAETGERLWESTFGTQVNFAQGLGLANGTLVVAGHFWDIGPGIMRAEVRGLDPDSGAVLWTQRPFRSFEAHSTTDALVTAGSSVIVGGAVRRSRTLPMLETWDTNGAALWSGATTGDKYGRITALAVTDGMLLTTGQGSRRADARRRDLLLQGHDLLSGRLDWSTRLRLGDGDAEGLAITTDGNDFIVAGAIETPDGDRHWTVLSYRR